MWDAGNQEADRREEEGSAWGCSVRRPWTGKRPPWRSGREPWTAKRRLRKPGRRPWPAKKGLLGSVRRLRRSGIRLRVDEKELRKPGGTAEAR